MLMRTRWATPKRQLPPGFIRPCQPVLSLKVRSATAGIHERLQRACICLRPPARRPSRPCGGWSWSSRINIARPIRRRLRPHCPVDAAPRTSLRRSQKNHQRAPEFRIGRSTPRRAIRPTKLPPRARRTSRQRAHVSSGTYGALSPRRQPSSPFRASSVLFFGGDLPLSWRIGRDRPPVRRVQLDLDTRCRYPTPVLPLPRLPTCLLWAEQE